MDAERFHNTFTLSACEKGNLPLSSQDKLADAPTSNNHGHLKQTKTFKGDVVTSWALAAQKKVPQTNYLRDFFS